MRGIRQGCILGPTLFGLLFDFLLHLADLGLLGVELTCQNKRELSCPQDILGKDFKEEKFGYADDLALVSMCLDNLSSALCTAKTGQHLLSNWTQNQRQKDRVVVALPTTNSLRPALDLEIDTPISKAREKLLSYQFVWEAEQSISRGD